jgi:ABC-type Mn2+/Zn2+ transport system ATPase subunit
MINAIESNNQILSVSGVTLGYPGVTALSNISFSVKQGDFIGIIGPNGSGKSSLLKGILGLLNIMAGEIRFCDNRFDISQIRREIGYVPQKSKNDITFPALVQDVVLMGLYAQIGWFHPIKKQHRDKAIESLKLVGMADYAERPIGALSGGQQQRVMIARALAADPKLLMLDEPTASVDISAQQAILETLANLKSEKKMTILMVTHDINEVVHSCDKILLINSSRNYFGTPGEVLTKENLKHVYGERIFVHDHKGHPHILVGDFYD